MGNPSWFYIHSKALIMVIGRNFYVEEMIKYAKQNFVLISRPHFPNSLSSWLVVAFGLCISSASFAR
jgi:hypothetical protein